MSNLRALAIALGWMAAAFPSLATAQTYVPFTDYLPPLTVDAAQYESGYNHYCQDDLGNLNTYQCVDKVIRDMQSRYDNLHATCDHRGLFALAYLVTTETYQRASVTPGFFNDPEFVNHEDVVFAHFYFHAFDAWANGQLANVPPAWRVAFSNSTAKTVTSIGDVLLGISAHINRDLPIVLATIGLVDPATGLSRKPDHDKVNAFLAEVALDPAEQAAWDPAFFSGMPGPASGVVLTTIQAWREEAWRHAEQLVSAATPGEQADVIAQIEWSAYLEALAIVDSNSYVAPLQSSAARDLFCMAHR